MTMEFDPRAGYLQHDPPPPTGRQVQLRRVGDALRHFIRNIVATEAPEQALSALADDLEGVAGRWADHPRRSTYYHGEAGPGGDVHAFYDDSPVIGLANPLAPPVTLKIVRPTDPAEQPYVEGACRLGPQYEGPPGHCHGGYVAAIFDEVLGMAQSLGGRPGMTGTLTIRYRSPTPLHEDLRLRGWVDRVEGRKIFTLGTLHIGDKLCAEGEAVFITIDLDRMSRFEAERAERLGR
jgi:acyl-coenzyme A thioesterase PaaI-like protein